MDVISDEGDHLGPIELAANVLDCLGDAWMASKAVVMAGAKDVQLGVLVIGHIQESLVVKEVATW